MLQVKRFMVTQFVEILTKIQNRCGERDSNGKPRGVAIMIMNATNMTRKPDITINGRLKRLNVGIKYPIKTPSKIDVTAMIESGLVAGPDLP